MILYINKEHCNSLTQLKDYFSQELNVGSDIYSDILDYGRSGDIAEWLREIGEVNLANKVDSIADNGDADFIKKLGEVLTGEDMTNYISKRPFKQCFEYQDVGCDVRGNDSIVNVTFKVIMIANETYKVSVNNQFELIEKEINPSDYEEGEVVTLNFVLHKPFYKITVETEGQILCERDFTQSIQEKKSILKATAMMLYPSLIINPFVNVYLAKKIKYGIKSTSDDEVYRMAKEKLEAIQKNIKENPCHVYDAYDGVGSSDREKEEEIINKEIRPLAERGHKLASIDYYWYLFVRRYEDAEKFAISFEENHKGEKLIETPLTDDQLYEKVQEMYSIISDKRSRSLSRTAWTGTHSTDINDGYDKEERLVFEKFIIPLTKKGYRNACLDYYHFLLKKNPLEARLFLSDYREKHPGDKLVEHANIETAVNVVTKGAAESLKSFLFGNSI